MNSSNNICGVHNKSLKFICFDCNVLMCTLCSPKHTGHSYDHIENIKSNKNNNKEDHSNIYTDDNEINNKSNNSVRGMNDIQTSIKTTFDSLKLKVAEYEQLQQTEQEIESKFKELHEFLVVEEHRLKKPIIDNKEQLEQQIDKQIKIVKSLNSINNHINITNRSDSQSETISTADTTDNYQITTIIRSISQSTDHNEFISSNNNTLFYLDKSNKSMIDNHSLLNLLLEHNKSIKINNHHDNQQSKSQQYQLIINNEQINQIKNQIQSSFKLISNPSQQNQNKQSYIFSTDRKNKISIINITDRNNIYFEQQDIDLGMEMNRYSTAFNSIVKAGDFIYLFGGNTASCNKFIRYSINTKTVVINEMKGVDPCQYLSACYDGQDHIYLFDGNGKPKPVIYRYNIHDSTFERYSTIEIDTNYHHPTFLYKDYIYSFAPFTKKILKFDIHTKKTIELPIEVSKISYPSAACTDGNGNIYIYSKTELQRINIETNEIKSLDNSKININNDYNLIFLKSNDGQSYIYSVQGKDRNFVFSLGNNKWESILQNDQSDRSSCANIFYQ
ncbi:hypothetical protein PPL_09366 [Heterostelium album PN500]|uniref:B box-type domain-containing protein n=1 Tax=Heterostelium pallidum (strain ATCC 26659 / Pp 5 / PN500) TaxID=670386 RepID=D3BLD2_HETP5|nr:hypothetical protein PPL_09366 [Heterostelium album PN500]EFA77866.1 hypothetical protein PPL_09366 [Heterostelium album PN500]|eukprot:XP_020429994.1 hypothetical protein PPL_09366 [Heterostelium album PN500]